MTGQIILWYENSFRIDWQCQIASVTCRVNVTYSFSNTDCQVLFTSDKLELPKINSSKQL